MPLLCLQLRGQSPVITRRRRDPLRRPDLGPPAVQYLSGSYRREPLEPCPAAPGIITGDTHNAGRILKPDAVIVKDTVRTDHTTADGRTLKLLNVIDEFTREALAITVDRCINADGVVAVLDHLVLQRGAPAYVRFDNGPEFVAHAVNDWCRFNSAASLFIDPGSPWQNAWIESFNGRLRDELLNGWRFDSLLEARVIIEDWRRDYNANRPHTAHGQLTPTEFALQWSATHQPQVA